jgi:hypothetical protein
MVVLIFVPEYVAVITYLPPFVGREESQVKTPAVEKVMPSPDGVVVISVVFMKHLYETLLVTTAPLTFIVGVPELVVPFFKLVLGIVKSPIEILDCA